MYDREADVNRVMNTRNAPSVAAGESALDSSVSVNKAFPGSK